MAPTARSFSAEFDPLALIERYPERYPGLLESSAPSGTTAGFDLLPITNGECLRLDAARRLSGPHSTPEGGFLSAFDAWFNAARVPPGAHALLPFVGGWLLYLGYELAQEIEPRLRLPACPDTDIALALRAPAAWVRERESGAAWLVCEPGHEILINEFEAHVTAVRESAGDYIAEFNIASQPLAVNEDDPAIYLKAVEAALARIAAGDVYQANLSRCWQVDADVPIAAIDVYRRLRHANPSPFAAYFSYQDLAIVCSSPERLVELRDGEVTTRPIAGTRPRGASHERDRALMTALLSDEKEQAEHVMLIDLERNDVGRVCVGGTVQVDEYMTIETYPHVHHIVSNIRGRQRADASPVDVLRALFPGGSITGCPKVRCMEIIAELEGVGRGAYTGSLGYLNRDGSGDFNILIRSMTVSGNRLRFRAGAGIVADSKPRMELAETRAKAEGLLRALR